MSPVVFADIGEVISPDSLIPRHGRDGRPKVFPESEFGQKAPKGEWYTRTTTFIDCLDDKSQIADWKLRLLMEGIHRRPNFMEEYLAIEDPLNAGKGQVNKLAQRALQVAGIEDKADVGSAIHKVSEDLDAGKPIGWVPPEFEKDIAAYVQAVTEAGLKIVGIENFAVLDEYKVAGTFDRLVWHEGKLKIADIKTGRIDFGLGKIAMQLAAYSRMKAYDPVSYKRSLINVRGVLPDPDEGLIIHLPAGEGKCDIVPVDIAKGWEGLGLAYEVRSWRQHWGRVGSKQAPIVSVTAA